MAEELSPKETIERLTTKYFGSSSPSNLYSFAEIHKNGFSDPKLNAEVARVLNEAAPETKKESARREKQLRDLIDRSGIQRSTSGTLAPRGGGGGSGAGVDIEGLPAKLRPRGGKQMKKGGKVKSASARADGIAKRGKTRGKIV